MMNLPVHDDTIAGVGPSLTPLHVLADGDGSKAKGFKAEWCVVKGERMYIGGMYCLHDAFVR